MIFLRSPWQRLPRRNPGAYVPQLLITGIKWSTHLIDFQENSLQSVFHATFLQAPRIFNRHPFAWYILRPDPPYPIYPPSSPYPVYSSSSPYPVYSSSSPYPVYRPLRSTHCIMSKSIHPFVLILCRKHLGYALINTYIQINCFLESFIRPSYFSALSSLVNLTLTWRWLEQSSDICWHTTFALGRRELFKNNYCSKRKTPSRKKFVNNDWKDKITWIYFI